MKQPINRIVRTPTPSVSPPTRQSATASRNQGRIEKTPPVLIEPVKTTPVPKEFSLKDHRVQAVHQKYFKQPDSWVKEGARLQFYPVAGTREIDVVIGLDFGTSFTKAAVGMMDQIHPVTWEGVSGYPEPYLLPSEYTVMDDGHCFIGQVPGVEISQIVHRLKHPFIDPAVTSESIARATVFVGLVLQYIRAWLFHYHGLTIGNQAIRWQLNIGAPCNGLESSYLEHAYRKLAVSAWTCSQSEFISRLHNLDEMQGASDQERLPEGLLDLAVLPEFLAQIAGYVKSARRRPGLHALVDVGGGTLDVVTFIVHEQDKEDVFPFLVPEIRPLGTQMLNMNRLIGGCVEDVNPPDELEAILDEAEFAARCRVDQNHVGMRDELFFEEVRRLVQRVLFETKQKRDPNSSHWTDGLPMFLTGGGAGYHGYEKAVQGVERRLSKALHLNLSFNLMQLPCQPGLSGITDEEYQRISVACGLAMDAMNLGRITPAVQVEDILINGRPSTPRVDHEDIYG